VPKDQERGFGQALQQSLQIQKAMLGSLEIVSFFPLSSKRKGALSPFDNKLKRYQRLRPGIVCIHEKTQDPSFKRKMVEPVLGNR
jgi:hypothetical protein